MMERLHRNDQSGFTIIELMIAMTVGMMLMAILGGIYFNSVQTASGLVDRINMNRQAREMFDILAMGGARVDANKYTASTNYLDNHHFIFGIRGRYKIGASDSQAQFSVPGNIILDSSATDASITLSYKLGLANNTVTADKYKGPLERTPSPDTPITSSEIGGADGVALTCKGERDPVGGCVGTEQAILRGFLRAGLNISVPSSFETNAGTLRIPLMLINPNAYYLSKSIGRVGITDDQIYDTYWTAFRPLVEYHP